MTHTATRQTTYTIRYRLDGIQTYEYLDGYDRLDVRRVFKCLQPRAHILTIQES